MPLTYATCFANQEQPELAPNEVAGRLADLTGLDHHVCHRALIDLNPSLFQRDGKVVLSPYSLPDVSQALARIEQAEDIALPTPMGV